MTPKISILSSLCGIALTLVYAATWNLTWLYWAFVAVLIAKLSEYQWDCELERRQEDQRSRERVRLMRQQEDYEIWCTLQEERAHRRIMETAVSIHDRA